jgi:hypothetical protein
VDNLWNNLVKGLQEGALAAADKAGDLTRLARVRLDIAATKSQLHRTQAELGAVVHKLLEVDADPVADEQVQALSQQLKTLDTELISCEATYKALQSELADQANATDTADGADEESI